MKKMRILRLFIVLGAIILEILPYGAVCVFATPEETYRRLFSYFSLVPYGYANFAPLITALLTCILLVLATLSLIVCKYALEKGALGVSVAAAIISLAPLLYGTRSYSLVGGAISVLLLAAAVVSFPWRCENGKKM